MKKERQISEMIDNYDILNADVYFSANRIITNGEIDKGLKISRKRSFVRKIENYKEKYLLYLLKNILLNEMKSGYYQNAANIKEIVDINTHLMHDFVYGQDYMHVENLVIWQNGFYNFNCFNFTTPSIRKNHKWNYGDIIYKKQLSLKENI